MFIFCLRQSYVALQSTGFRDFLLKPELLSAIQDHGFESPSEGKSHHVKNRIMPTIIRVILANFILLFGF